MTNPTDNELAEAFRAGPGQLWALPENPTVEQLPQLTETDLAVMDAYVDNSAALYDQIPGLGAWAGDALREAWTGLRPLLEQRLCDCERDPHHRWNCPATPLWAQTIRDLDTNPWIVFRPREMAAIGGPIR